MSVVTVATAAAGALTIAFGSALYSIGVLNPTNGYIYSEVRAISGDGAYAAGVSTSAGANHTNGSTVFSPPNTNAPVVWSVSGGLVELPNPNNTHCIAIGVAVGVGTNTGKILFSGLHEKATVLRYYEATISSGVDSGTWADAGAAAGFTSASLRGGAFNNSRNSTPNPDTGWPPLAAWWSGATRDSGRAAALRADPFVGWDGLSFSVQSISGYGRVVGRYSGVSPNVAQWDSSGDTGSVPNSSGARADGFGISTMFGTNLTDFAGQWICGQVQNYNGVGTTFQAFRWNRADADMTYLGSLAPVGGGDTGNNSSCAYTIANNGVTGGRSYFGAVSGSYAGYEVATVWDTSGTWDTTGTPQAVEALLTAEGVDTSAWTHLTRVYAVSDDGKVLGGFGIWAADGSTRGFVAIKTTSGPVVQISHVAVNSGTVTIDFTSSNTSDTTASFAVQEAGTLANAGTAFTDMTSGVTITGAAGSFQASFALSGNQHFYRIHRL